MACTFATLLIPVGVSAQLGGVNVPDVEVPPLPQPPVQTPEIRPPPATEELLDGVEQGTGIDMPELGGEPSAQPPQASPDVPAPAPEPAADPPDLPQPDDPPGGTTPQGSSETSGSSPSASPPGRGSGVSGGGADARDGAGADARPPRQRSGASATGVRDGEQTSPVGRVLEAIGALPWSLLVAIAALAGLGLLMAGRSALLVRLARRLTNQGDELREDVGALQTALLPTLPGSIGSVELSVAYRAAEGPAAGGDFHDVLPLEGGRVAVIVGDVSGHGREALTITPLVHYTVRAYLEAGMEARHALRLADQALGGKLGRDFATVLAAIYDGESSTLEYATAGHPAPLIIGPEGDHAVTQMTPPPIGVGPPTGFRQTSVALAAGSRICFFTDGLIERRDEDGAMLAREGLRRSLAELDERIEAEAALDRVAGSSPGGDDVTVCLVRPLHATGDGTVVDELELEAEVDPEDVAGFLHACGLDGEEADAALEEIAGRTHASFLRVVRGGERITFEVTEAPAENPAPLARPSESPVGALAR